MSWFHLRDVRSSSSRSSAPRTEVICGGRYVLTLDEAKPTCLLELDREAGSGIALCGFGLMHQDDAVHIITGKEWLDMLSHGRFEPANIGGHFAGLWWSKNEVRFFNDGFGQRDIFFQQIGSHLSAGTHADDLARDVQSNRLNTQSFGGKWNLYFQCDHGALVQGMERLGPGGTATIDAAGKLTIERQPMRFEYGDSHSRSDAQALALKAALHTRFALGEQETAIALSGGVDSRMILAALDGCDRSSWSAFTFGNDSDADVRVARMLADKLNFKLQVVAPSAVSLSDATDFVTSTDLYKSISQSYTHLAYRSISATAIVDGTLGELLRRKLFRRLELTGKRHLLQQNWDEIAKYIWTPKPDIWERELGERMRNAALEQVRSFATSLPAASTIGVGNWLDLLFCQYWFSNTSGLEQRRLDNTVLSTGPFAEYPVISDVFRFSEEYRASGKLASEVLNALSPRLAKYPYAKDELILPSWTPWYVAKMLGKLAKKRSTVAIDQQRFLADHKDAILDTLLSQSVRECSLYNYEKIRSGIEAYYAGTSMDADLVDWWYSFEVWRSYNKITDAT